MEATTTTETETETHEVTKDDVRAIRECRGVVFFYRPDGSEGPAWGLRLLHEVQLDRQEADRQLAGIARAGLWTRSYASEWKIHYSRTIAADAALCRVENYEDADLGQIREVVALDSGYLRPHEHVTTALGSLRAGDEIGLRFIAGNNSENTRSVHWTRDECYLRISRKGRIVGEYLVDVYVGPRNSARMARFG